jgi:hypothetical protein
MGTFMTNLPLPLRCLTLLPPWPQAIRYAEKRLENRGQSVAKPLAEWRYGMGLENAPVIGLSQSKKLAAMIMVDNAIGDAKWVEHRFKLDDGELGRCATWEQKAGTLWLCAELLDVLPPDKCEGDPWHVPGQWGLILGRVWEVKPVPCMGGQGAWRSQWCPACKKIIADSHGLICKRCLSTLVSGSECPELEVITEVV